MEDDGDEDGSWKWTRSRVIFLTETFIVCFVLDNNHSVRA